MNGVSFLADTNVFIYLMEGDFHYPQLLSEVWAFSFITEIELLSKKSLTTEQEYVINNLLENCSRFYHNQQITNEAIRIRKVCGLKLPDAIIAATSIVSGLPLVTGDKEFEKIENLDLILIQI